MNYQDGIAFHGALLVTGPCVTATIDAIVAGTSEAKTGATVSLREVDIDITFRLRTGRG
jgi:hypothetical protein